ncbi:MAG: DEAD/DEAH box helicase [Anaerolineae bacterium]|nr:DEAD/DEAH box helicase [Anaerolineae bacterium]
MKPVRLLPVRHQAPVCASFASLGAVREFERAMRVHRAHTEGYAVTPLDGRVDGDYEVRGPSGGSYIVDLVDSSRRHDACTCPDFLGNELGTCKHLEAVRRMLQAAGPRSRAGTLPPAPREVTITVAAEGSLGLQVCGPFASRALRELGFGEVSRDGFLSIGAMERLSAGRVDGVRVVHAAAEAHRRLRARVWRDERSERFRAMVASGQAGVDVLSQPLFPYQRDGVLHLGAQGRALLADDMGLGKTVQAIAACEVLMARGEAQRVVVVTPASLKHQWAREIERYAGRQAVVLEKGKAARRAALRSDAPYKVLSYELTWRELPGLRDLDADVLILDEAQRAKNFRTRTAATLRAIPSRFLFELTGTPVENRLDDLYSLLQLVDPDVLGPLWRFNLEFHKQDEKGKVRGYKNLGELRARIAPVVLRRRKEEVLTQLPPLVQQTRYIPLSKVQKGMEEDHRARAARYMALAEKRPLRQEEMQRLQMALLKARQACNAAVLCDPGSPEQSAGKLDELEALIEEVVGQGTSKVLVFSEWVEMLKLAAARLDAMGVGWEMLHGGVPSERRPALLDRFRADPELRVLLCSDAGGVGLNLQVANYVIHLDLPWNPARLDQRTSRAHRLGQSRGVSVTYLCAEEGIERGIEGTLAGKRAVRAAALDPTSDVEELPAPSFAIFLREVQQVMERLATPGRDVEVVEGGAGEEPVAAAAVAPEAPVADATMPADAREEERGVTPEVGEAAEVPSPEVLRAPGAGATVHAGTGLAGRARNRLKLATVVLAAGFPADAVRAAYEALASAIGGLLGDALPRSHAALVAAVYRELLPAGRLAASAPAALARLHDLMSIEDEGIEVDRTLASEAVDEAESWVARLVP